MKNDQNFLKTFFNYIKETANVVRYFTRKELAASDKHVSLPQVNHLCMMYSTRETKQ